MGQGSRETEEGWHRFRKVAMGLPRFVSIAIFGASFIANALWMLVRPLTYSFGPSGVVYSLWGVLMAFTLFDGMPKQPRSLNPRTWYADKKERSSAIGNLAIFSSTA